MKNIGKVNKKKKKHWTTKNTHLKHLKNRDEHSEQPMDRFNKVLYNIGAWLIIIAAILFIILKALDNRVVGYDHFPSIPVDWIRWLK
jgi:hypothetical protein